MGVRLGGQDKPLLEFKGRPMIEHVISSAPDLPLMIGGATTSKAHTAVKIEPHYQNDAVVYVTDEYDIQMRLLLVFPL